jgi:hypothetical protein
MPSSGTLRAQFGPGRAGLLGDSAYPSREGSRGRGPLEYDWKAERIIGIEILDANAFLPADLLAQAEIIG